VVRTRVGYAGGTKKNPTYHDLGDHTETIQMEYDPAVISYEQLLDVFWDSHDAAAPSWSRQYMSIIFTHDEEQKRLATESRDREAAGTKSAIVTVIRPAGEFYRAEGYHQKFRLRSERELVREFTAIYPSEKDFVDSTAVARVNGYLDGYGTPADLKTDLPSLGLSPKAGERLTVMISRRPGRTRCRI
jgi:peptide-methionine (S)-S-oxide reductase